MRRNRILVPSGVPGTNLRLGDHLCHVYYSDDHFLATVVPYIKAGLENGEKCTIYLADGIKPKFLDLLGAKGQAAVECGSLEFLDPDDVADLYASVSGRKLEQAMSVIVRQALDSGYKSLRVAGQVGLILPKVGQERMLFVEMVTTRVLRQLPAVLLCEYPFVPSRISSFPWEAANLHPRFFYGASLERASRLEVIHRKERGKK